MAKRSMPDWLAHLVKEFTTPPPFLDHILKEAAAASGTAHTSPRILPGRRTGKWFHSTPAASAPTTTADPSANETVQSSRAWRAPSTHPVNRTQQSDRSVPSTPPSTATAARSRSRMPSESTAANEAEDEFVQTTLASGSPASASGKRSWQAAFRQAGIPPSMTKAYGWTVHAAEVRQRVVKVRTQRGIFAVKRTHTDAQHVRFLHELVRHLRREGLTCVTPFALADKDKPYITRNQRTYYATRWVDGNPVNFSSLTQLESTAAALAEFHERSRGFESSRANPTPEFGLPAMLRRRSEDLRNLLLKSEAKQHPDEFDQLLSRIAPALREDAEKAVRIAESADCRRFLVDDEENPGLCHLDVIPDNFIYTKEKQVVLIDLDLATFAPRVLDLSHLLRRSLQRLQWRSEAAYTCFLAYDRVRPMDATEYLWVYGLLCFPYRAWRLAHTRSYVVKDRTQIDELRECVEQEPRRQAFLEALLGQIRRQPD